MIFAEGHIAHFDTAANAVMSEVFAMQCQLFGAQVESVMTVASSLPSHFYYRYL